MSEHPELEDNHTCGVPASQSQPKSRPRRKRKDDPAQWNVAKTERLLDFLYEKRSEAGEGFSFKIKTFNAAAEHLATVPAEKGGIKDGKSCQSKYNSLKGINDIIQKIKDHTGWGPWSDEHGAGITALTSDSWEKFVAHYTKAKPFRNHGWLFLQKMERLIPYKPKGTHVYRPAQGRSLGVEEGATENEEARLTRSASEEWDLEKLDKDMAQGAGEDGHDSDIDTMPEDSAPVIPKTPAPISRKCSGTSTATPLPSGKKPKGVDVLSGLLNEVTAPPSDPALLLTPARRDKAVKLVERETDLPFEEAMAFCQILVRDKAVVDMYNSFTNPEWHRAFITSTLARDQQ
ncbi:hypothetical protein C8R42DRAFT_638035 [Lentinula raphanica]|nr:hypothetical protein C8R42DRAFT_638035 [Lentinula raphanica]